MDVSNSMMIAAQSEAGAGVVVNGRGTKSFDELAREGIMI